MKPELWEIIVLISPLVIGGIIAAINMDSINKVTEKIEGWIRKLQSKVATKKGWLSRFFINPILWIAVKFSDWTDVLAHRGLKNGLRVLVTLYLILLWIVIIYIAVIAFIIIAIVIFLLYLGFHLFSDYLRRDNDRSFDVPFQPNTKTEDEMVKDEKQQEEDAPPFIGPGGVSSRMRKGAFGKVYVEDNKGNKFYKIKNSLGEHWEDQSGNKIYKQEGFLGGEYYEDNKGNKISKKEDFLAGEYYEDKQGNKVYKREGFLEGEHFEKEKKN